MSAKLTCWSIFLFLKLLFINSCVSFSTTALYEAKEGNTVEPLRICVWPGRNSCNGKSPLQPRSWISHKDVQNIFVLVAYSAGENMEIARWWNKLSANGTVWPSAEYLPTGTLASTAEILRHGLATSCHGLFLLFLCLVFDILLRIMSGMWNHYIKVAYCLFPYGR